MRGEFYSKVFPLGDPMPSRIARMMGDQRRYIAAVPIGEIRPPKKGEWYLSGALIAAYKAPCDLEQQFHIAKLVRAVPRGGYEVTPLVVDTED